MSNSVVLDQLIEVPVEKIEVNPNQPRKIFSHNQLQELTTSIEELGIIQPPVARYIAETDTYELISGERRFRAAQATGMNAIPIILRKTDSKQSAEAALVENLQRVDLNPIEVAQALKSLSQQYTLSQDELAQRVGKKRSTVANYLRLLMLPSEIQESLSNGEITTGHAKAILSLETELEQKKLHQEILQNKLTVREAESSSTKKSIKKVRQGSKSKKDPHIQEVELQLSELVGTKVQLQGKANKGKVVIDYYSADDLEKIISLFSSGN